MRAMIHLSKIGRTPDVEDYIMGHLTDLAEKTRAQDKMEFEVWVENIKEKGDGGVPEYETRLAVRRPRQNEIFIRKADEDFFRSFKKTMKTAKKKLSQKRSEMSRRFH